MKSAGSILLGILTFIIVLTGNVIISTALDSCEENQTIGENPQYNWDNAALNKSVNASSFVPGNISLNLSDGFNTSNTSIITGLPQFAVDGDKSTFWEVNKSGSEQLIIDLGKKITIADITLIYIENETSPVNYSIALSNDNITYNQLINITNNVPEEKGGDSDIGTDIFNIFSFVEPQQARYIKLNITDNVSITVSESNQTNKTIFLTTKIAEIEVSSYNVTCLEGPSPPSVKLSIRGFVFDPTTEYPNISSSLLTSVDTGYFVIQADRKEEEILNNLSVYNAEFFGYIPGNGLLVYANASKTEIQSIPGVRFVDIYQPAFKLEPFLFQLISSGRLNNSSQNISLNIRVFKNIDQVKNQIINLGGTAEQLFPPEDIDFNRTLFVDIPETKVINISFIGDVQTIELQTFASPDLDVSTTTIGVRIGANQPNLFGLTGIGQIIGFRDTGVDTGNATTLILDIRGRVINDTINWRDDLPPNGGHGTHVVGIAIGNGALSGAFGITGVAPGATAFIRPHRADAGHPMNTILGNASRAGARIHGDSWGVTGAGGFLTNQYHQTDRDVDNFTRENQHMLVVKSAGNCGLATAPCVNAGNPTNIITSPGNSKNIIAVGASGNVPPGDPAYAAGGSNPNSIAGFSSRGPSPDGRVKPDVAAPGDPISSLSSQLNPKPDNCNRAADSRNQNYTYCAGTSMAQPHVSGMAALIREYLQTKLEPASLRIADPTGMLVKAFIINGAEDMPDALGNTGPIPNNLEGWGRVNLTNSIAPGGIKERVDFKEDQRITDSAQTNYSLRFSYGFPINITLVWYDLPDTGGSGVLINDLDMELAAPSGKIYRGGAPSFQNGESQPGGNKDGINTVEKIVIKGPEGGFYNLTIKGAKVKGGTQSFAIVASQIVGVDSVNSSNNYTKEFVYEDIVYGKSVGLPENANENVYVVKYEKGRDYSINFPLAGMDVTGRANLAIKTGNDGSFNAEKLWDISTASTKDILDAEGKFNIIVDVNNNGRFDRGIDVVDDATNPGFTVNIFEVNMINVGVGDSILMKNGPHNLLIDAGSGCEGCTDAGYSDKAISTFLKKQNISQIETLVITHDHNDHTNKLKELEDEGLLNISSTTLIFREGTKCNPIFCTGPLIEKRYKVRSIQDFIKTPRAGSTPPALKPLLGAGVEIEAINDGTLPYLNVPLLKENDRSLVLKLSADKVPNKKTYLFGGDCGGGKWGICENEMLSNFGPSLQNIDVYKVHHHGSITSSTVDFINAINPKIAILSAGEHGNSQPNAIIQNRLRDKNAKLCKTFVHGDISSRQVGSDLKLNTQNYSEFCPDVFLTGDNGKALWEIKPQDAETPKIYVNANDVNATGTVTIYAVDHETSTPDGTNLASVFSDKVEVMISGNQGRVEWPTLLSKLLNETVQKGRLGYDLIIDVNNDGIYNDNKDFRGARVALPQENTVVLTLGIPWHLRSPSFKIRTVKAMGLQDAGYMQKRVFNLREDVHYEAAGIKREVGETLVEEFINGPQVTISNFLTIGKETALGRIKFRKFDVYVVKHGSVTSPGQPLQDVTDKVETYKNVEYSMSPPSKIWTPTKDTDIGEYDIVLDMRIGSDDPNGKFDPDYDLILGRPGNPAFVVTNCKETQSVCGIIESSTSSGTEENVFSDNNPVNAKIEIFSKGGGTANAYIVDSVGQVENLDGSPLIDVSGGPRTINLPSTGFLETTQIVWPQAKQGRYDLILDVDGDGKFNKSVDIYDPDGFIVTRDINSPRIAVDSKGNLHVVALENGIDSSGLHFTDVLYAKVPVENAAKIDTRNPDLFDWSKDSSIDFKAIRRHFGSNRVSFPDIAVDSNDEPHIIYSTRASDFDWLFYIKLDKNGNRDRCVGESSPGACDGPGSELLTYHWDDFEDIHLYFPSIAIDPKTNQPVVSADVSFVYPDTFYFNYIYPECAIGLTLVPVLISPLLPFPFIATFDLKSAPIQFMGDSIQVARRVPGSPGKILDQWPYNTRKYRVANQEVNSCLEDVATSAPHRDRNWDWIAVDVGNVSSTNFDNSKVAVDNNSAIHVVYRSKDNPEDPSLPTRLFYSKIPAYAPVLKEQVSDNIPVLWFPWIDIDPEGRVHTTWQSGDKIYYNSIDASSNVGTQQEVSSLKDIGIFAKPSVRVDSQNNPHIFWKDRDANNNDILKYSKGKNDMGTVNFEPEVVLVNSSDFPAGTGALGSPMIDTNKLAGSDDWTDRVYVGWLEISDKTSIKFKKTTPHVVTLLVIDGISKEFLNNNLSHMPNLQKLINDNPTIDASIFSSLPDTTMSAQAELFTGLGPKKNHVIGDNFEGGIPLKFLPENSPDTVEVNNFLSLGGAKTLFDYLKTAKRSKAAIPSIYTNGIDSTRPDFLSQAQIDFFAGKVLNEGDRTTYLSNLKNNDKLKDNDVADLLVAYILTHDHGVDSRPDPGTIDSKIGEIINALDSNKILNDTIFVITSDHGFIDTIKDDSHSLDNTDLPSLINPAGTPLSDLFLNGRLAYSYSSTPRDEARVFYNNSFVEGDSIWFGKINRILVKDAGQYNDYSFNGSDDALVPASDSFLDDLTGVPPFAGSPDIILIAKSSQDPKNDYYFQTPHKAIYGDQALLPFIITGKGFDLFSRGNNNLAPEIPMVDAAPTLSYFTGGQNAVDLMTGIDGKNLYEPEFTLTGGSPVNFHLYDSQGRHVGPDAFGNIQLQILGSNYEVDEITDKKTITLLRAPDQYRVEIQSLDYGAFGLSIKVNKRNGSFSLTYPETSVSKNSYGKIDLNGTFDLMLDFNGDGIFENTVAAQKLLTIVQDEKNNTALARLAGFAANDSINVDLTRSTDTQLDIETSGSITDGIINVAKISDPTLDSPGFFTLGSFVRINFSDPILNSSGQIKLTINYPDYMFVPSGLSEKSLSIYEKGTHAVINSTVDTGSKKVTAIIGGSGEYVVASTDLKPRIGNVTVEPQATNVIRANVKVTAGITDNVAITNTTVTLSNATGQMVFNPATGQFEATIIGPEISGRYPVLITVVDANNNTATKQSYFILDLIPPKITIFSPKNISYVTNRINLSYYVDEESNQSYTVDGGGEIAVNNTKPYNLITIPLTLSGGNHSITVSASDVFGNMGSETVVFEIESQNIMVSDLAVPIFSKPNKTITIKARVTDTLIGNATGVEVQLLVDGNISATRSLNITGETGQNVEFPLVVNEGRFNISVRSVPLPEERIIDDNILTSQILVTNKVPLLLVDDDPAGNGSVYKDAILAAPGYDFILYDISQSGLPNLELLKEFPLVVWFSGGTLTSIESETLKAYLNNSGYLLLFGNSMGRNIGDTDFYKNFLFAQFRRVSQSLTIEGAFRDPVGGGFLFSILEPGEEIKPISPATESFRYSGGESAAIKADNGLFKTVYFTFGLEDVPDQDTRNRIMGRVLDFFGIDFSPPVITNKDPEAGFAFPMDTANITLSLQTNEIAKCRFSDVTNVFDDMTVFNSTNSLYHSTLVTNLTNGRNYTFYINCEDRFGNRNNTESFTFYIYNRTFLPPVLQPISDITVFENETAAIPVNATDPDGDPITLTISDREIVGFVPIASRFAEVNQTFMLHTNFDDAGRYYLRVTAYDGFSTVTQDFILTIINVNRPPVLAPIGNQTIPEGTFFSKKVSATDPDGQDLTFSDDTTLFDINPFSGVIAFTPQHSQIGVHYVNISVTDGELTDSEVVAFNITGINHPPVIEPILPQRASVGELFTLQINASDIDGDPLIFSADTVMFNISAQGLISFTPAPADAGSHLINITVTDGLLNDTKLLDLVVSGTNRPPIITSITDRIVVLLNQTFYINVTACDPDLDPGCV